MRSAAWTACCSTRTPRSRTPLPGGIVRTYRMGSMAAAIDRDRAIATAARATVTPEAVVIDRAGVVRYRGRIDDTYVALGRRRPAATRTTSATRSRRSLMGVRWRSRTPRRSAVSSRHRYHESRSPDEPDPRPLPSDRGYRHRHRRRRDRTTGRHGAGSQREPGHVLGTRGPDRVRQLRDLPPHRRGGAISARHLRGGGEARQTDRQGTRSRASCRRGTRSTVMASSATSAG